MSQKSIDKSLSMKTLKSNCPAFPCCSAQLQNVPATKQWLSTKLSQNHKQNMRIKSYVACSLQMLSLSEKCAASLWTHTHTLREKENVIFTYLNAPIIKCSYLVFLTIHCTTTGKQKMQTKNLPKKSTRHLPSVLSPKNKPRTLISTYCFHAPLCWIKYIFRNDKCFSKEGKSKKSAFKNVTLDL